MRVLFEKRSQQPAPAFSTRYWKPTIKAGSNEDRPCGRWLPIDCCWAFLVRTRGGIIRRAAQCCIDRCRRGCRSLRHRPCVVRVTVAQDSLAPIGRPQGQPSEPDSPATFLESWGGYRMAATRTSTVLTVEICELFLVGAQLGQDPVLIGDLDDVGGVDVFPLDSRRVHF
jgi:hypothetical protein